MSFDSEQTMSLGEWLRFECEISGRSQRAAIADLVDGLQGADPLNALSWSQRTIEQIARHDAWADLHSRVQLQSWSIDRAIDYMTGKLVDASHGMSSGHATTNAAKADALAGILRELRNAKLTGRFA